MRDVRADASPIVENVHLDEFYAHIRHSSKPLATTLRGLEVAVAEERRR
jgi:hypothetical protein